MLDAAASRTVRAKPHALHRQSIARLRYRAAIGNAAELEREGHVGFFRWSSYRITPKKARICAPVNGHDLPLIYQPCLRGGAQPLTTHLVGVRTGCLPQYEFLVSSCWLSARSG